MLKPEEAAIDCLRKFFIGKTIKICLIDGEKSARTISGKIIDIVADYYGTQLRNFFFVTDNDSMARVEIKDYLCAVHNKDTSTLRVLRAFNPEIID
jgi:hypothetical protein